MKDNQMINNVIEFNKAFDVQEDKKELYIKLIEEEFEEWVTEAYAKNKAPDKELKELCDLLYVLIGYGLQRKWDVITAFNRVHESNLSKLGSDGRPVRNKDGKVQKGVNYKAPDLKDLV